MEFLFSFTSVPLVAAAVVTTIVWVIWKRGWWLYQLTLLGMAASVIFCVAMANANHGLRFVEYPAGHPFAPGQLEFYWHPLVLYGLVAAQWRPDVRLIQVVRVIPGRARAGGRCTVDSRSSSGLERDATRICPITLTRRIGSPSLDPARLDKVETRGARTQC